MELDDAGDGLGAAVAGTSGVEEAQERLSLLAQRLPESDDFRDHAGRQRVKDLGATGASSKHRADLESSQVGAMLSEAPVSGSVRHFFF